MVQDCGSNKMTRQDLILKIISLYPDTFRADREEHVQSWVEMYEKAINKSWDMDKLMWYFATDYKSTVVPPPPSFFYNYRKDVMPEVKAKQQERIEISEEERVAIEQARKKFLHNFKLLKGVQDEKDIKITGN